MRLAAVYVTHAHLKNSLLPELVVQHIHPSYILIEHSLPLLVLLGTAIAPAMLPAPCLKRWHTTAAMQPAGRSLSLLHSHSETTNTTTLSHRANDLHLQL